MQTGKRQMRFGVDAVRLQHSDPALACQPDRLTKQSRLADPGLSAQQQRAALAADAIQNRGYQTYLDLSAEQRPGSCAQRAGHDPPILSCLQARSALKSHYPA